MDHIVLPANNTISAFTTSRRASPPFARYSLRLPTEGWPGWVDLGGWLDWDKSPALGVEPRYGRSPIPVLTRPGVEYWVTSLIWPTSLPTVLNRHQCSTPSKTYRDSPSCCTKYDRLLPRTIIALQDSRENNTITVLCEIVSTLLKLGQYIFLHVVFVVTRNIFISKNSSKIKLIFMI